MGFIHEQDDTAESEEGKTIVGEGHETSDEARPGPLVPAFP